MIQAYFNYPNPHVTIHADSACAEIQKQNKPNQRVVKLTAATATDELQKFATRHYRFAPNTNSNDMWLEVDFGNMAFEKAVVNYVVGLLGKYYTPFANVDPKDHDCN